MLQLKAKISTEYLRLLGMERWPGDPQVKEAFFGVPDAAEEAREEAQISTAYSRVLGREKRRLYWNIRIYPYIKQHSFIVVFGSISRIFCYSGTGNQADGNFFVLIFVRLRLFS